MFSINECITKAAALHGQGLLHEAIELLTLARSQDVERPDVHFNLGLYFGEAGEPAAAAACFKEVLRCRPDWIDGHIYLIANTLQTGDIDSTLGMLTDAFKLAPENPYLHEQFAIAMGRKLELEERAGDAADLDQAMGYLQSAVGYLKALPCSPGDSGDSTKVRRHVEMLSRVRGAVELAESSLAKEHGRSFNRAWPDGSGFDFPGFMILTTMPKSGSEYVWMALTTGLNLRPARISSADRIEVVDREALDRISKGGFVSHGHIPYIEANSVLLSNHADRLVVHVRDPRQALISWINYLDHRDVKNLPSRTPWGKSAEERFKTQMDYFIGGFYSDQIAFLRGWMDADRDADFMPRILFTRQEDLRQDPRQFFQRILNFYEIQPDLFRFPDPPKAGERHFRRGETDEWRSVLQPKHIDLMQAMLSDDMLEHFGWSR
jgi:tetratricopeptide (TPR) repeat protein